MIIWAAITNNPLSLIGTYTVIMWSFKATRWWYRRRPEKDPPKPRAVNLTRD